MVPDSPQQQSLSDSGISSQISACYDAEKSCIRLLGGECVLEGSIIEIEQSQQFAGTFLVGEVMEVVIMGDNMVPIAVHNEKVKRVQPVATDHDGGSLVVENRSLNSHPKKYVYDELRRAEIQSLMKDKTIGREEKLRRMAEIKAKYDDQHSLAASSSRESLQSSSPFNSLNRKAVANNVAPNTATPSIATQKADTNTQIKMHQPLSPDPDPQTVTPVPESSSPVVNRWNRAAVAAVTMNAVTQSVKTQKSDTNTQIKMQQPISSDPTDPQTVKPVPDSSTPVNRWNRAAVAAVSMNAVAQSTSHPKSESTHPSPKVDDGRVKVTIAADSADTATRSSITKAQPEASDLASHRRAANRWNRAAVAAVTTNTFTQSFTIAQTNVNQEDVDGIIEHLSLNNSALKTLILDGRRFDDASWERLFDSIEENKHLTKLSVVDCGLNDYTVGALVLALVENETLISIDLSHNEELTDETGLGLLKVIKQGNAFVKKINIEGTSISPEVVEKIQDILCERDDSLKLARMQKAREAKIKALLSVTASDQVRHNRQPTRRLSSKDDSYDDEEEDDGGTRVLTTKKGSQRSLYSTESKKSGQSSESGDSSGLSRRRSTTTVLKGGQSNKLKAAVRANMATRQMANLGGDMSHVGKSVSQQRELRKQRGECVHCGQKCFTKTMFKTIPLTIPNKVQEGRCLRCAQLQR